MTNVSRIINCIRCLYCAAIGRYGDTRIGWRLARNVPFAYVYPKYVSAGRENNR